MALLVGLFCDVWFGVGEYELGVDADGEIHVARSAVTQRPGSIGAAQRVGSLMTGSSSPRSDWSQSMK